MGSNTFALYKKPTRYNSAVKFPFRLTQRLTADHLWWMECFSDLRIHADREILIGHNPCVPLVNNWPDPGSKVFSDKREHHVDYPLSWKSIQVSLIREVHSYLVKGQSLSKNCFNFQRLVLRHKHVLDIWTFDDYSRLVFLSSSLTFFVARHQVFEKVDGKTFTTAEISTRLNSQKIVYFTLRFELCAELRSGNRLSFHFNLGLG